MLPKDINILVSLLNTKLRDDDVSLETIIEISGGCINEVLENIKINGFFYDESINQIKKR